MSESHDEILSRMVYRMLDEEPDIEPLDDPAPMTVRVPESVRAMVDAMARQMGASRNSVAVDLLRLGISDVLARMPDHLSQHLVEEAGGYL